MSFFEIMAVWDCGSRCQEAVSTWSGGDGGGGGRGEGGGAFLGAQSIDVVARDEKPYAGGSTTLSAFRNVSSTDNSLRK